MTGGNIENQETLHYQTGNRNRVHQTPIIRAVIYPIQLLAIYKNRFLLLKSISSAKNIMIFLRYINGGQYGKML